MTAEFSEPKEIQPKQFLSRIFPDNLLTRETLELRVIDRETQKLTREFVIDPEALLERAAKYTRYEVYFGVSTRFGESSGKKHDCYRVRSLWADFDGKKIEDWKSIQPRPNLLVQSGSGLHVYWTLESPVLVRNEERWSEIEAIHRAISKKLGSDRAAIDITRILRVPGPEFRNHKYDPPRPVTAFDCCGKPYSINQFKQQGLFVLAQASDQNGQQRFSIGRNVASELPKHIQERLNVIEDENWKDGDKSRQDESLLCAILAAEHTPEDALATVLESARGGDIRLRKNGHHEDYAQRTLLKAVSWWEAQKKTHKKTRDVIPLDFSKGHDPRAESVSTSSIILEHTHKIEPQRTEWLWKPYIPAGRITILAGDPGMGKSQIAIDLVSRLSRGAIMPKSDEKCRMIGGCAIASAEDHTAETIIPRIIAAGGNRQKIKVIRKVEIEGEARYLSFPRDFAALKKLIVDLGLRMLVLDPMNSFLSGAVDVYKDHDIRLALTPFEEIAEVTGCALLIIAHLNKKEEAATLYRVGGSIGYVGAARSVLAVSKSERSENVRVLYSIKSNLSKRPPALEYALKMNRELDTTHVVWGGLSSFDPERVLKGEGSQKRKECEDFLSTVLVDGPVPSKEIKKAAAEAGICWRTLYQHKRELGVTAKKQGDRWLWIREKKQSKKASAK